MVDSRSIRDLARQIAQTFHPERTFSLAPMPTERPLRIQTWTCWSSSRMKGKVAKALEPVFKARMFSKVQV